MADHEARSVRMVDSGRGAQDSSSASARWNHGGMGRKEDRNEGGSPTGAVTGMGAEKRSSVLAFWRAMRCCELMTRYWRAGSMVKVRAKWLCASLLAP